MQAMSYSRPVLSRTTAAVEILVVLLLTMLAGYSASRLAVGQNPLLPNLLSHLAFAITPIVWLILSRRSLADFGVSLGHWRADWNAAMTAYFPVALGASLLGFLDYRSWLGAVILALTQFAVLFAVARQLQGKPDPASGYWMLLISSAILGSYGVWRERFPGLSVALLALLTYLMVGVGEEILYRGFIQSRLNQAFGRPYRFYGVAWGWGVILTALVFGLTHTGLVRLIFWPLVGGDLVFTWPWGLWTFCGGLVFGFVREKTGGVLAPSILHGLPQAVAVIWLGL